MHVSKRTSTNSGKAKMSQEKSHKQTDEQAASQQTEAASSWFYENLSTLISGGHPPIPEQEIIEKAALATARLLDLSNESSANPSLLNSVAEATAALRLLVENHDRLTGQSAVERGILEAVLCQMPSSVVIAGATRRSILFSNVQSERLWGHFDFGSNIVEALHSRRGFHEEGLYEPDEWPLARSLHTGEVVSNEDIDILRSDGTRGIIKVSSMPVRDRQGQIMAAVEIAFDFTELKQAETQIRELKEMLDESEDAIMVREMSGRVLFWNKGAEHMFGWTADEAMERNVRDLLYIKNPTGLLEVNAAVFDGQEHVTELRLTAKDGREITVEKKWAPICDETGKPKAVLVIMSDITKTKKIEAQLFRLERLDSIGAFAAGMAHDLGNALAPILMAVQLLRKKVTDENSQRHLTIIQQNVKRSIDMVKRVLGFVRGGENERVTLQLQPLIYEIEKMLKGTLPKSITLEISVQESLWSALGNATQIHRLIMNLCVNARDAMPEGGRLLIAAENVDLNENATCAIGNARPGQYVLIRVADTGTGIPAHILKNIFDPFFTTKGQDKGTGLGLAMVSAIVNDYKGFIDVTSEVGKGTEFRVYLPATEATQESQPERSSLESFSGQGEMILVADDEAAVQEITKEVLETFGYRTLTASDGMEAVMVFSQHEAMMNYSSHKDPIRVVFIDMVMPYLNGLEAIRVIRNMNPEVKIIAMSGPNSNVSLSDVDEALIDATLPKPYTARKLLETLAELLAED